MPTTYPVLVPRRPDNGKRDEVWSRLKEEFWIDYNIIEGHDEGPLPFNRSAAINAASDLAGEWDYAIIADADSCIPHTRLSSALLLAQRTGRVVIPHSRWVNIEEDEIDDFFADSLLFNPKRTIYSSTLSSILVVPRRVWDAVNGFDERFVGWGWEDTAFMEAVSVLGGGYVRMEGDVYHLAHDRPAADTNRQLDSGYIANRNQYRRYKLAKSATEIRTLTSKNRVKL